MSPNSPIAWTLPQYEATTIESDGTSANRYDVRKTLAYLTTDMGNVNNVFMLYNITTEDGKKFHLTTNAGMKGTERLGTFISLNDLQTLTGRGGTLIEAGAASSEHLNMHNDTQSVVSPTDGDKWTNTRHRLRLSGIELDTVLAPTGKNFYYGGSGGIQLMPSGNDVDPAYGIPGWSWYWANPNTRVSGTLNVDGTTHKIDPKESFALFERQWGNFGVGKGYYLLWLFLETGEVLCSWSLEPELDGTSKIAFASIWHPNGLHEMIPVGPNSKAEDISTSSKTGVKYFNKFFLDLPTRNASFTFKKWIREAEITPTVEQRYIVISESYGEGTAHFNGKDDRVHGHVEQLSTLK